MTLYRYGDVAVFLTPREHSVRSRRRNQAVWVAEGSVSANNSLIALYFGYTAIREGESGEALLSKGTGACSSGGLLLDNCQFGTSHTCLFDSTHCPYKSSK